jgi:hypothetical protein
MSFLIYINGLGPNYKGDNIYEFIFSDTIEDIWGENWESKPANGYPSPPDFEHIKKVGTLKKDNIVLDLVQDSDVFSVLDATDGVIALGWEKENNEIDFSLIKRLVFKFGDTEQEVKDKLYERDIVLEFEKKMMYEN